MSNQNPKFEYIAEYPVDKYRAIEQDGKIYVIKNESAEEWADRIYREMLDKRVYTACYFHTCSVMTRDCKYGIAKCHPHDVYNLRIGLAIAYLRAIGQEDRIHHSLATKPKPEPKAEPKADVTDCKFHEGDRVRAKKDTPYGVTTDGWEGKVVSILSGGERIVVKGKSIFGDDSTYAVLAKYFDLIK